MATNRIIKSGDDIAKVVQTLARCPDVAKFDERTDKASASLAYCFDSLEGHFREFLENQLPQLAAGKLSDQEVCDLLHDIGTVFGQILWHIRLPRFYHYLEEEKSTAPRKA
jgi:hypothetical protein